MTLDYGAGEPKTVVTGATNIAPGQSGMKVILGLRGTQYFFTDKDGKKTVVTLEPKALRGIMNDAMCMSNFELGISDEHEGIILLDDADPAPGTPVQDVLGEIVVELDVLPNMARCLSMIGIAREVAALTGAARDDRRSRSSRRFAEKIDGKVKVEIADPKLCPRYTATVIRNVTVGPAPRWMRSRLHYAGMRPINNVVDVTNYVMLEYGQPLHAFDYDVLVKRAGGKRADDHRPPGEGRREAQDARRPGPRTVAGQPGHRRHRRGDRAGRRHGRARNGGHRRRRRTILLESASFDFVSVRKTARQFNLFSEASTRFSRGVHPELAKPAAHPCRGAVPPARRRRGAGRDRRQLPGPAAAAGDRAAPLRDRAGCSASTCRRPRSSAVLTALAVPGEAGDDRLDGDGAATRLDIQAGAADLIEELARVYGYDKLPERLLPLELPEPKGNRALELEDRSATCSPTRACRRRSPIR